MVKYSENFETLFFRDVIPLDQEDWDELLDAVDASLMFDPFSAGESLDGSTSLIWVYESPPIKRLPKMRILYEIARDKGVIILTSIAVSKL